MKTKITCEKTFRVEDEADELCMIRVTKHDNEAVSFKVVCAPNFLFDTPRMDAIIGLFNAAKEWSLNPE